MIRILAVSDTHLEEGVISGRLEELIGEADMVIHAGDFISPEVYDQIAGITRLEAVYGNSDLPELKKRLPERKVLEVEGVRIGVVHMASHSSDLTGADLLAREMEVGVLIFGHIHRPMIEGDKRLLICPGSPTFPRMSPPTVAEVEVDAGQVRGKMIPLGGPTCDYLKFAGSLSKKENNDKKMQG
jgi:uncharacterized protein